MSRAQASLRLGARPQWRPLLRSLAVGAAVLAAAAGLAWGSERLSDPQTLPVRQVDITGELRHVQRDALRAALAPAVEQGFLGADMRAIQRRVEALPWVDSASVRRIWPDRIVVSVQEQAPVARWAGGGFVNRRGEVFAAKAAADTALAGLPLLQGQTADAGKIVQTFRTATARLRPLGLRVTDLSLDARGELRIGLGNGIELVLGRADTGERLQRFLEVWPQVLAARAPEIARIDLRYGNGFAVKWKSAAANG